MGVGIQRNFSRKPRVIVAGYCKILLELQPKSLTSIRTVATNIQFATIIIDSKFAVSDSLAATRTGACFKFVDTLCAEVCIGDSGYENGVSQTRTNIPKKLHSVLQGLGFPSLLTLLR